MVELHSDFNYIRVRSFILSGVPFVRRRGRARDQLELLSVIKRSVPIEPHLDAQKVASDVVNRRFEAV
jgi:hypothetical protein